ncbi:MAG TPA: SEC-C metal-binding domain-containing protein [Symbiobacteriaceae bacterium]|nr:SEC-C metal-binding domain-containing protein [Symbiobacteriaceae bacterium]
MTDRPDSLFSHVAVPHESTTRKTGRNMPCPCGSGRKYKKCCLAIVAWGRGANDA